VSDSSTPISTPIPTPISPSAPAPIVLTPLRGIPGVQPGDDLAAYISDAARRDGVTLAEGVLVVCQKIVSKAEGRLVSLADVEPSEEARRIAA